MKQALFKNDNKFKYVIGFKLNVTNKDDPWTVSSIHAINTDNIFAYEEHYMWDPDSGEGMWCNLFDTMDNITTEKYRDSKHMTAAAICIGTGAEAFTFYVPGPINSVMMFDTYAEAYDEIIKFSTGSATVLLGNLEAGMLVDFRADVTTDVNNFHISKGIYYIHELDLDEVSIVLKKYHGEMIENTETRLVSIRTLEQLCDSNLVKIFNPPDIKGGQVYEFAISAFLFCILKGNWKLEECKIDARSGSLLRIIANDPTKSGIEVKLRLDTSDNSDQKEWEDAYVSRWDLIRLIRDNTCKLIETGEEEIKYA